MWMVCVPSGDPIADAKFQTLSRKGGELHWRPDPPRDLTFASDAWQEITRASLRVFALDRAMMRVLPFYASAFGDNEPDDLAEWVAIMRNRFTVNENGSFTANPTEADYGK
jgi:hypothetical protein